MNSPAPQSRVLNAAAAGLSLGLLLAGVLLFTLAMRTQYTPFDCGALTPDECILEEGAAREWSRVQLYIGTGLTLLGFGLLLWLRSSQKRQGRDAETPTAEG